jgi:hypothetical protein
VHPLATGTHRNDDQLKHSQGQPNVQAAPLHQCRELGLRHMEKHQRGDNNMSELALICVALAVIIAVGVAALNYMMDDDEPIEHSGNGNLPKPPPEPGH